MHVLTPAQEYRLGQHQADTEGLRHVAGIATLHGFTTPVVVVQWRLCSCQDRTHPEPTDRDHPDWQWHTTRDRAQQGDVFYPGRKHLVSRSVVTMATAPVEEPLEPFGGAS